MSGRRGFIAPPVYSILYAMLNCIDCNDVIEIWNDAWWFCPVCLAYKSEQETISHEIILQ